MEVIAQILGAVSAGVGITRGAIALYPILAKYIRGKTTVKAVYDNEGEIVELIPVNPGKVTHFLNLLGLATEVDVEKAMANWSSPPGFTDDQRSELTVLLKNLVRGAKFHSTHGTRLSNYLTAEKLIEQLLQNVQPQRRAGERLDGWILKQFLGMGGFGEVWRAENPLFPASHVYKFFTQERSRDWLKQEAEALFAVGRHLKQCPNVIDYLNVNIDAQPHPYLVLEYAAHGSLEDWILAKPEHRAKISVTELMRGIARGVSDAHKHHIHHRDLKPANILLAGKPEEVTPMISDFGLSSVDDEAESRSSQRSQAVLVGTSMYQPPEASNPFRMRNPAQDDVFALGVVWYQILTGELVRPSYDFAEQLAAVGADPRSIRMIANCLANPTRRYPSACELYDELDNDAPPGPGEWVVPEGCFDVAGIAREYLERSLT
jgi:hypothetical protein